METGIIVAGFGGQGVLFGGLILAQAALEEGKYTTWFPSYGAEMRGGTANSTVVISDEEIGSPVILHPSAIIAMNDLSLDKFSPRSKPGAIIVINSSLIKDTLNYPEANLVKVPATEIADTELGSIKAANLVMVGTYLKVSRLLSLASTQSACKTVLSEKPNLISMNQKALELGYNFTI